RDHHGAAVFAVPGPRPIATLAREDRDQRKQGRGSVGRSHDRGSGERGRIPHRALRGARQRKDDQFTEMIRSNPPSGGLEASGEPSRTPASRHGGNNGDKTPVRQGKVVPQIVRMTSGSLGCSALAPPKLVSINSSFVGFFENLQSLAAARVVSAVCVTRLPGSPNARDGISLDAMPDFGAATRADGDPRPVSRDRHERAPEGAEEFMTTTIAPVSLTDADSFIPRHIGPTDDDVRAML